MAGATQGGWQLPPPKFWALEQLSESHLLVENFCQKCKILGYKSTLCGTFKGRIEIMSTRSEICSIWRNIATSWPATFFSQLNIYIRHTRQITLTDVM